MPHSIVLRPELNLNIVEWQGPISLDALRGAVARVVEAGATKFVLWDFSQATSIEMLRHQIEQLVTAARAMRSDPFVDGRTAIVVPSDLLYGMARQAQAYASLTGPGRVFEVFRDRQAALAWLGLPS